MRNPQDLFKRIEGIPRSEGWMKNPYLGKDGKDYHSVEELETANRNYCDRMFREIPEKKQ